MKSIPLLLCLIIAWYTTTTASADVRLPNIFGNDMVLQRDKPAAVWGWAKPGEKVTVRFAGQQKDATAAADGKWLVKLDPMAGSKDARDLVITGTNTVTFHNIAVGDVWVCSGDFGVFWEMFSVIDAEKEVAAANYPDIRLLKVTPKSSNEMLDDIEGAWRPCSPAAVTGFSALAYFFGQKIHREINVPVGLIDASYRYSYARGWMPPEAFHMVPELKRLRDVLESRDPGTPVGQAAYSATLAALEAWLPAAEQAFKDGKPIPAQPKFPAPLPATDINYLSIGEVSLHYQGMIHPLTPFAIRGVVWSQGENSCLEPDKFRFYMKGLVESWRKAWGQGDFPFYIELLAAVNKPNEAPDGFDSWGMMREEQMAAALSLPNSGMAVTFDVSDYVGDLRDRQDAGRRLALVALAKEYHKDMVYSGPVYHSHIINGNRVIVSFDHVGSGLMIGKKEGLSPTKEVSGGTLAGFTISGADKKWYWAEAKIEGNTVVLQSDKVPTPVAVRYACSGNPSNCNLYNRDGLPAAPFRMDAK